MTDTYNKIILTISIDKDVADFIERQSKEDRRTRSSYVNEVFKGIMDTCSLDEDEMEAMARKILDRLFKEDK